MSDFILNNIYKIKYEELDRKQNYSIVSMCVDISSDIISFDDIFIIDGGTGPTQLMKHWPLYTNQINKAYVITNLGRLEDNPEFNL